MSQSIRRVLYDTHAKTDSSALNDEIADYLIDRLGELFWILDNDLVNNIKIGVFRTTGKGKILHVNEYMTQLLGYESAEQMMDSVSSIVDELYQEPEKRREMLGNLQKKEGFTHFITAIKNRQGQTLKLEVTLRIINDKKDGEIIEGFAHDVSEREKYLQELERSKANLDAILYNARQAYVLISKDQKIRTVNKKADHLSKKIWGKQIEAGVNFDEFIQADDLKTFKSDFSKAMQGEEVRMDKVIKSNNKQYNFVFTYIPVVLKNGNIDSVVLSIDDITQYKQIQNQLNNTINELEDIFENSMTAILVVDKERRIRKMNAQVEKMLGYSREELLNQSVRKIHKDKQSYLDFRRYYREIIEKGSVKNLEYSFRRKDGSEVLVEFTGKYMEGDAHTDSFMIIWNLQDITERKRNQLLNDAVFKISQTFHKDESLSELLKEMQTHLYKVMDVSNLIIALYDEARDYFNLPFMSDMHDDFIGFAAENTISKLVVKENKSYFLKTKDINELIESGKIKVKGTIAKVWLGVPMRVKGEPIGVIVVQDYNKENAYTRRDLDILEFISDQVSMSIHRKRNEELLRENIQSKDKIFSIIGHDLKSPFNSLIGLSSLLKEGVSLGESDRKEIYDSLHQTAQEGYSLLDNLLLWTRSQLGHMEHQQENINLKEMAEKVVQQLENSAIIKEVTLRNKIKQNLLIPGDENKLQTILRNLVSNALKYSHPGSSVEISAYQDQRDVVVSVKDYGIGMSENMAEQIFSPGIDTKRPGTSKEKGTGLGLLISREFVEHHKGKIWAESEKGKGSVFSFSIPVLQSKEKKYEGVDLQPNDQNSNDIPLENLYILIVEDVEVNYVLLKKMLEKMGAKIAHAWNGAEAVEYCDHQRPDAVLMDINMPKMNGIDATKALKTKYPDLPVIIQTAYANTENRENSRKAGADDYLEKPIIRSKLLNSLRKLF